MNWTTSESIAEQILKLWNRGDILAARITGEMLFPLELRVKRPTPGEVTSRFGEVQDWVHALSKGDREIRGFGFELRYEALRNKVQGTNELPVVAIIPSELDALLLIRREAEADRFEHLAKITLARFPTLRNWMARRPLSALKYADEWKCVLSVLAWFVDNPRPGLYLRQLDIPGVDTKFIETHRGLLAELLDLVLPESMVNCMASGLKGFSERYGLRAESPLVRFRLLDPALYIHGLSDLSLPAEQFGALELPARKVFITENRINGLSFPACPGSIVIFGLGYGVERLAEVDWLHKMDIYYWGDIDTHGFGILNRLRATFSDAQSFLMDWETLEAHRSFWGQEPIDKRYAGEPSYLTVQEQVLFDNLRQDKFGECIRLEQEKIGYRWVEGVLGNILKESQD